MEARLKDKQAVEATIEVTIPAAEVDQVFDRVLRQLARQVRIPGFRPGKAPRGVLLKRIGEESLQEEVREELVEKSYPQAIQQFELMPVHAHIHGGHPSQGQDFTFDFHVDLYPEFELPDLNEIVIDSEGQTVDDEMIASTVTRLQSDHATLVPVDRAVQAGDYLLVESVGEDDEPEGGGETSSAMPIDLESVSEDLAAQLVGKSVGEVVELRLAEPAPQEEAEAAAAEAEESEEADASADATEDDSAAEEAEASAPEAVEPPTLKVRITDVKEKEKPEPDDEFAKTLGFENWQETVEQIRATLQAQLDEQAFEEQRDEFVEKLMANAEFELPNSLVQQRKANLLDNLNDDLRRRGITMEQYVQQLDSQDGREEFDRELQEAAEKGVKRDMVLERLLEQRGTKLSDSEFEAQLRALAQQQNTDVQRLRRDRGEEWERNYRFLLTRDRALNEAVQELLNAQKGGSAAGDEGETQTEPSAGAATAEADSAGEAREQASPAADEGDVSEPRSAAAKGDAGEEDEVQS